MNTNTNKLCGLCTKCFRNMLNDDVKCPGQLPDSWNLVRIILITLFLFSMLMIMIIIIKYQQQKRNNSKSTTTYKLIYSDISKKTRIKRNF